MAACLAAVAIAAVSLGALHASKERAAVAMAEQAAVIRSTRSQTDALETDLRRVLMLMERAKEAGASSSRIDLAVAEHDLLQHEIALLEPGVDWSAGAATLLDLRQLLAQMRARLVTATQSAPRTSGAPSQPVRALTGDAPEALSLLEKAGADVMRSLTERSVQLQLQQQRLQGLLWLGAAGFALLLCVSGIALYLMVVRPLSRLRSNLQHAIDQGGHPAALTAGGNDVLELAVQARRLVAQVDERQAARVTALREQLAVQAARAQQADQARERAEQASRNRADFIVQLGHELRTPLTGMLGLIELLVDDVRGATGQRRLQSIQGAALLLRGVLDRMSDVSTARLPRVDAAAEVPRRSGEHAVDTAPVVAATELPPGARVLVAEDHAINQVVITEMLEHLGHSVEVVPDGRRAVERVRERLFDVVLMDWAMPEMDGVEATRLIRAEESRSGRSRVPIIALTAHTVAENRRECLAAGMDDFLAKPVTVDALDAAIRRAVA